MTETPDITIPSSPTERIFPPWSVGRIVFWIAAGVVLSIVGGALIGVGVVVLSIWL